MPSPTIQLGQTGMTLSFVGLKNFRTALFADPEYVRTIAESVGSMVLQVPVILVFSLFISLLLNQKFRGRTLARAIFFLPVIVVSGIICILLAGTAGSTAVILIGGPMLLQKYKEMGLHTLNLSRTLEDFGTGSTGFYPWTSSGILYASVLGAST